MEAFNYLIQDTPNENVIDILKDNAIISITDPIGRIEFANDNFCKILECNPSKLIGEPHKLLKSHLHSDKVYKDLWKTIKKGEKWHGILNDNSYNGKPFWLETTIVPIKDSKKNIIKYISIYKDVTEYYKTNTSLLETNLEKSQFLRAIPLNVFSITRHGKIVKTNKGFNCSKPEDLSGTYIYDYFNWKSFESIKNNIEKAFTDKLTHQFEFLDLDTDGKKNMFSAIISPNYNDLGGVDSATIAINEITKFKGVSDKLKDSEAKFRLIYQSINVGIIVVADEKGNISEWNKGAEAAFGYSEIEVIGRPLTLLMSKEYKKANIKELIKAIKRIKNNKNADIIEMCCLRKNGEEFPIEFALSLSNIDGNEIYCAMMLDISKRKHLEAKLKQKTKDLELFLYRSAHDLRAPFSSAQGLINLLKEENKDKNTMPLIKMLETTINEGRALSDSLAEASTVSAKKHEFKKINFQKSVDDVLILLSGLDNFKNIQFNIDLQTNKPFKSKPELINSIFQNLIQNAIKYSKKPSKYHIPIIDIEVHTNLDEVLIKVCDNGIGIDLKSIDKIFDLYYRCNDESIQGNGLGLYIVKSIIESLGGSINVETNLNLGACFEIHLPYSH